MAWIEQRTSGRWTGYFRNPAGKRRSAGTFATEKEALRRAETEEDTVREGTYFDAARSRRPLTAFADAWVENPKSLARSSHATDVQMYRKWIRPRWGDWPIAEIHHNQLQAWIDEVRETRSRATAEKIRNVMSKIFRAAIKAGWAVSNPVVGLELGPNDEVSRPYPTPEQVLALCVELGSGRDSTMVRLAYASGLRPSELVALEVGDVNVTAGTVRVTKATVDVGGTLVDKEPKSKAGRRTVPIPGDVVDLVRDLAAGRAPTERLFTADRGGTLRINNWQRRVMAPARDDAGIPATIDMHALRHGAVSNWAATRSAKDLIELRTWAGHASITVTADRYGHYYEDVDSTRVSALEGLMGTPVAVRDEDGVVVPMARRGPRAG